MPYKIAGIDVHKRWLVQQQVEEVVMESPPNIGNQFGEHWNGTGNRSAGSEKAQGGGLEHCIWHRRCRKPTPSICTALAVRSAETRPDGAGTSRFEPARGLSASSENFQFCERAGLIAVGDPGNGSRRSLAP